MSSHFEHVNSDRVRQVLNYLAEAPFFYVADDADLFAFLRKHRAEFERFYRELFGWQLVVDARGARLVKDRWWNPKLTPRQHDVFDLTRRDDCIAFLLVLEFHERLLEQRNVAVDDPEPLCFQFGELFSFALGRFREELGDRSPDEEGVRRILRGLMPTLLRFRFLRELLPPAEERALIDADHLIYECLPGLYLYDVRALARPVLSAAYTGAAAVEEQP